MWWISTTAIGAKKKPPLRAAKGSSGTYFFTWLFFVTFLPFLCFLALAVEDAFEVVEFVAGWLWLAAKVEPKVARASAIVNASFFIFFSPAGPLTRSHSHLAVTSPKAR